MTSKVRKNVLIVIPNLGRGGAQQIFHQQMKYLPDNFETMGCVFNWDGSFPQDRAENIYSLDVPAGKSYWGKAYYFLLRITRLKKLKRDKQIQVSISHLEGADYVNILSRNKDKIICWIHGTKKFDQNIRGALGTFRKHMLMPFLYRKADRVITVSQEIRTELKNSFNVSDYKLETIYNGIDLSAINKLQSEPLPVDFPALRGYPVLITHCRLALQKNLSGLLFVMSKLLESRRFKLVVLGDGELRDEIIALSRSLQLKTFSVWEEKPWDIENDVYFLGYKTNPYPYLRRASLYLMTSDWEGFPLSLCESMACELPVISTDCYTGPREILTSSLTNSERVKEVHLADYGILMPLINSKSQEILNCWSAAILRVLDDKELQNRYSGLAKKRATDFDIQKSKDSTFSAILQTSPT